MLTARCASQHLSREQSRFYSFIETKTITMCARMTRSVILRGKRMDHLKTDKPQRPPEAYLLELAGTSRQKAITVLEIVANFQGIGDWHLAQWQRITADELPGMLEQLRTTFPSPTDLQFALGIIKGVARCAWRQKLISGQQLAVISKWKSD